MIYSNDGVGPRTTVSAQDGMRASWLDLALATDEERAAVTAQTGLDLPDTAALAEVEASSRLNVAGQTLTLTTPLAFRDAKDHSRVTPVGFVLTPERLVTIRTETLPVFDAYAIRFASAGDAAGSGGAFVGLLEAIVDRLAEVLRWVGGELDRVSRGIFRPDTRASAKSNDGPLREVLRDIGRKEVILSNVRDSLLGIGRMVPFVRDGAAWLPPALGPRLETLHKDIQSLSDYDAQLENKVQFLLDATLGFISIEQNDGIKILTVVSVVGVPPTLVASIYGMNFKWIPELQWDYGYFYGLAVIALSAVVPLLWFRRRGWI